MLLSLFNRAKPPPQQQWRIPSALGVRITYRAGTRVREVSTSPIICATGEFALWVSWVERSQWKPWLTGLELLVLQGRQAYCRIEERLMKMLPMA
jgi:hypothetical protein